MGALLHNHSGSIVGVQGSSPQHKHRSTTCRIPGTRVIIRLLPHQEVARLKILDDVVVRALSNMTPEERRDLVLSVVDRLLDQMSADERRLMMEHVVDHFLDTPPNDERAQTVRELV